MKNIHTLIFFTSETCNLNCQYCLINEVNKDNFYIQHQKKLDEALENKTYINNYISLLRRLNIDLNNIKNIELWGQEPTINLEKFYKNFDYLYKNFPNINSIVFSTNGVNNIDKILEFIKIIENNVNSSFNFKIQFSLDGEKYTLINRGIKEEIILENVKNFLLELNKIKLKKVKVNCHFHNVISKNIINELISFKEIENYWQELNEKNQKIKNLIQNDMVNFANICVPGLEFPMNCFQQDGKNLNNFIYNSLQSEYGKKPIENILINIKKHWQQILEKENYNFDDIINIILNYNYNNSFHKDLIENLSKNCFCGYQSAALKMTFEGNLWFCQNMMFMQREEDFKNLELEYKDYFKFLLKKERYLNVLNCDYKALEKIFYIYDEIANTIFFQKFINTFNLMLILLEANQISSSFKNNNEKILKHCLIITLLQNCSYADIVETGSFYGRSLNLIRTYCNGFSDIIENYILKGEKNYAY